ncbi:unnamed protein product [Discosporangium mesarthrocarpum]
MGRNSSSTGVEVTRREERGAEGGKQEVGGGGDGGVGTFVSSITTQCAHLLFQSGKISRAETHCLLQPSPRTYLDIFDALKIYAEEGSVESLLEKLAVLAKAEAPMR